MSDNADHADRNWLRLGEEVWLRKRLAEQAARLHEKPTGRKNTLKKLTAEQTAKLQSVGIVPDAKPVKHREYQVLQKKPRSSA